MGDNQGGSWDVHGILRTAWRTVCMGTTREDPGMSMGSSRLPGGLRVWGKLGRILGCPWDPPNSMEGCVCGTTRYSMCPRKGNVTLRLL